LELIHPVSKYFISQGFRVVYEVRIGFCRADLVAFKEDVAVAVELKLRDWKKALLQAKNYQLGADLVYLAVPLMKSSLFLQKSEPTLQKEGIGLLVVNELSCEVSEIMEARTSQRTFAPVTFDEITKQRTERRSKFKIY